jgi:thiamine-monophosphate kinase
LLDADPRAAGPLVDIYRRPVPLLADGQALAPHVNAMMDVSDGLLLDTLRLCQASGCGALIDLDALPLSRAFVALRGESAQSRLFAATGGDDYALLATIPGQTEPSTLSLPKGTTMQRIGTLEAGEPSIRLTSSGQPVDLPERLGFEHSSDQYRSTAAPPRADRP